VVVLVDGALARGGDLVVEVTTVGLGDVERWDKLDEVNLPMAKATTTAAMMATAKSTRKTVFQRTVKTLISGFGSVILGVPARSPRQVSQGHVRRGPISA
jgi:hypothetical protein